MGGLSGGQRAKLELIRAVFLRDSCPSLLLLDEPFAALDPASKAAIMRKLKAFCRKSVLIVVYHPEAEPGNSRVADGGNQGQPGSTEVSDAVCSTGAAFFDAVLEVRDGKLLPPTPCTKGATGATP